MARPPRIPNWLPRDRPTVYFITFCVEGRRAILANEKTWQISLAVLERLDQWGVLAAIAMPDHLHLLAAPLNDREASITAFSKWFKRWFNEAYWRDAKDCRPSVPDGASSGVSQKLLTIWQEGCFDHLLRSNESLSEKWEYLRQNPVRADLVSNPEDWPYQFAFNSEDAKL